jgi:hypothetical protein
MVVDRLVDRVSRKTRWWMATGFVLATSLALIFLVGLTVDQGREISNLRAARIADEAAKRTAENTQAVVSCLRGVYEVPDFLAALDGLDVVMMNQIEAAQAALALDPNGPLAPNRRATLRRALRAQAGLARLISGEDGQGGIVRQRTTLKDCRRLADDLGVAFAPLAKQAADR